MIELNRKYPTDKRTIEPLFAAQPRKADGCDFPACQTEKYQKALEQQVAKELFGVVNEFNPDWDQVKPFLDRIAELEKDAARYQWLKSERKTENYEGELAIEFECGFDHYNDIDAAIDAAMEAK